MRSAIDRASSWSCVTKTAVVPVASRMSRTCPRTSARSCASRFENGSSSSSSVGSGRQRPGERDALLLPAGELVRHTVGEAVEVRRDRASRRRASSSVAVEAESRRWPRRRGAGTAPIPGRPCPRDAAPGAARCRRRRRASRAPRPCRCLAARGRRSSAVPWSCRSRSARATRSGNRPERRGPGSRPRGRRRTTSRVRDTPVRGERHSILSHLLDIEADPTGEDRERHRGHDHQQQRGHGRPRI